MCKDFVMFPSFTEPEETYLQFSEVEIETTNDFEDRYESIIIIIMAMAMIIIITIIIIIIIIIILIMIMIRQL